MLRKYKRRSYQNLKKTYEKYKQDDRLNAFFSNRVFNTSVSTKKFDLYETNGIASEFFNLIYNDPDHQIDDDYQIGELGLSKEQIDVINHKYNLDVQQTDIIVDLFEKIKQSSA